MTTLERLLEGQGLCIAARWPAHAEWRGNTDFERALEKAHVVVINGEGTIHHDRPSGLRLLEIGAAAKAASVPAALVNTGWEANGPAATSRLADFALIAARDSASAAVMRQGNPEVRIVPDLSLCSAPPSETLLRQDIGFTDNVLRLRALELARLCQELHGQTISIHHRQPILAFLRAGLSLREDWSNPGQLADLLAMRLRMWRASTDSLDRFIAQISGLQLLVSGRFHACTLALVAGTPFVAQTSNTGKIASLVADAGLDPNRARMPDDPASLRGMAERGWSRVENEARVDYLAHARSAADSLAVDLRALVT